MSPKFAVYNFEWIKDSSQFNEDIDKIYFLHVYVQYLDKLHEFYNDKTKCFIHLRNLQHALNHKLLFRKFDRMVTSNQIA